MNFILQRERDYESKENRDASTSCRNIMLEGQKVLKGRLLGRVFKRLRYIMMITTNINYFFYIITTKQRKRKRKERLKRDLFLGGVAKKKERFVHCYVIFFCG